MPSSSRRLKFSEEAELELSEASNKALMKSLIDRCESSVVLRKIVAPGKSVIFTIETFTIEITPTQALPTILEEFHRKALLTPKKLSFARESNAVKVSAASAKTTTTKSCDLSPRLKQDFEELFAEKFPPPPPVTFEEADETMSKLGVGTQKLRKMDRAWETSSSFKAFGFSQEVIDGGEEAMLEDMECRKDPILASVVGNGSVEAMIQEIEALHKEERDFSSKMGQVVDRRQTEQAEKRDKRNKLRREKKQ